jgi:hypothetical protein
LRFAFHAGRAAASPAELAIRRQICACPAARETVAAARAAHASRSCQMAEPAHLARPVRDVNHVLCYGGSLAQGYGGWPALSLRQPHDSLMLGDSVRPLREDAASWQPVGEPAFRPLVATVQDLGTGVLLAPGQVAGLPPEAVPGGETVLEAAVNFWRARLLAAGGTAGQQRVLASACGVGGRTLAALSKGARPHLFNRLRGCARLARDVAADAGLSYGIAALLVLEGEADATADTDTEAGAAAHTALLRRLYDDAVAELAVGIAAQDERPAMFLYQAGGAHATEANRLAQAQLDCALDLPGCVLVAPAYPLTERGGLLDANGYRWLGAQFGKVMHRVLTLGETWRPLHPLGAEVFGKRLTVRFHVPVPPLQWGKPIVGQNFVDPQQRGFTVLDAAGAISIMSVDLDGPDTVAIVLARAPQGATTVRYADRRHAGRGALHDSDAEAAMDPYVFDPTTGHAPRANLKPLVGRAYPLVNWCVAFAVPVIETVPPRPPETPVWKIINDTARPPPPAPEKTLWQKLRFWRR